MNVSQQIASLLAKRGKMIKALETLNASVVTKDGDVESMRAFTADEQTAFNTQKAEIEALDVQVAGLKSMETLIASGAVAAATPLGAIQPTPGVAVKAFKPFPGQVFTRLVGAVALSKGNLQHAEQLAKRWDHQTPEVSGILKAAANEAGGMSIFTKAAVAAGTTVAANWALPLVNYTNASAEFVELLRPETVVDKLAPKMRRVPFNTRFPVQTGGATAGWVGEGLSKPVSALAFTSATFPFAKLATIVVITQELARFSDPSAELLVRDDLVASIAQFMDLQFLTSTVAPVANVNPGAITNGVTPIASGGSTIALVTANLSAAILAMSTGTSMKSPTWIMSPTAFTFLSLQRTTQDIFAWRDEMTRGTLLGFPIIVSANVAVASGLSAIILVDAAEILYADDGEVAIDASDQATLQMDSAPATPPTPLVSLWQQNMLGIKAERFAYWQRRRLAAVQVISGFPAP